jgi:hypothetical protein
VFHPDDYKQAMDKMAVATPADVAEAMKPLADCQAKFSQITLDVAKKNLAAGQAMVNETMEALDRFSKAGPAANDFVAASTEFVSERAKAMPKHIAAFADIAKTAQAEVMDVMLSAGEAAAAAGKDADTPKKETVTITTPPSTSTDNEDSAMANIKKDVMAKAAKN